MVLVMMMMIMMMMMMMMKTKMMMMMMMMTTTTKNRHNPMSYIPIYMGICSMVKCIGKFPYRSSSSSSSEFNVVKKSGMI